MTDEIKYPKKPTEVEVQAELWFRLKNRGMDARLEVRGSMGSRRCRFDIVVFRDEMPQAIIECKSWSLRYSKERAYQRYNNSRQLRKYNRYGLPVFICGRMEDIDKTVNDILESYHNKLFEHI